jgi:hypothetical protein
MENYLKRKSRNLDPKPIQFNFLRGQMVQYVLMLVQVRHILRKAADRDQLLIVTIKVKPLVKIITIILVKFLLAKLMGMILEDHDQRVQGASNLI